MSWRGSGGGDIIWLIDRGVDFLFLGFWDGSSLVGGALGDLVNLNDQLDW